MATLFKFRIKGLRERINFFILLSAIIPLLLSIILFYVTSRQAILSLAEEDMKNAVQNIVRVCEIQSEEVDARLQQDIDRSSGAARAVLAEYRNILLSPQKTTAKITNQDSLEESQVDLPEMKSGATVFLKNTAIVDQIVDRIGNPEATATIFQLHEDKLIRVSTNVKSETGGRAILTYIPSSSIVFKTIMEGKTYRGRAIVVNKWKITCYEPIRAANGAVIGAWYIGIPAPKTAVFDMIAKNRIGASGYIYVINSTGQAIAHPSLRGKSMYDIKDSQTGQLFIRDIIDRKEGTIIYSFEEGSSEEKKIASFTTFDKWDWHIVAAVTYRDILAPINRLLYLSLALLIGFAVVLVFSSRILAKRLTGPFRKIIDTAVMISNGNLSTFIPQPHYVKCVEEKNCTREDCPAHDSRNKACWRIEGTLCDDGRTIEQSGKLELCSTCEVYKKSIRNEMDELIEAVNNMIVNFRTLMESIRSISDELNNSTIVLSEVSAKVDLESRNQAAAIEETSSVYEELTASIDNVAGSTRKQAEKVNLTNTAMESLSNTIHVVNDNSLNATRKGRETVQEAHNTESMLKTSIQSINQISESSKRIVDIVAIINDISDQINLLSLNASIEAARAGEQGRGFAIVAQEISKLAEATAASTKEIEGLIKAVRGDIETGAGLVKNTAVVITGMIKNIEGAAGLIDQIAGLTRDQISGSDLVRAEVSDIYSVSEQIALATGEQKSTSAEILNTVSHISDSIQELAGSSQAITESVASLHRQAVQLQNIMSRYTS